MQLEGDNEVAAFLIEASRGGLWEPQQHLFQLGLFCWRVFSELKTTAELKALFLQASNQRELFCEIMEITMGENFEILFGKTHCTEGHYFVPEISTRFFNCMAKNFVKNLSDASSAAAKAKKIKKLQGTL